MLTVLAFVLGLSGTAMADGACCLDTTTTCYISEEVSCERLDGYYYGEDSTCEDDGIECPTETTDPTDTGTAEVPTGACCLDDVCSIMEEDPCKLELGTWFGEDTTCSDADVTCGGGDDTGSSGDDTGACCRDDTCFETTTSICESSGGYFYGTDVDCSDPIVECDTSTDETGACCVDDTCYELTTAECEDRAGYFYGVGVPCTDPMVECEPVDDELGACCIDGYCFEVTITECHADAGYWYGAGSDCSDAFVECPEPSDETGACCVDETCSDLTLEECHDRAGIWYGVGVPCTDPSVDCEDGGSDTGGGGDTGDDGDELGACCMDGQCYEITAEKCWDGEGAFYGPGSDCDDAFVLCCEEDDDPSDPVDDDHEADPVRDCEPCKGDGGGCATGGSVGDMLPVGLVALLALMGTGPQRRRRDAAQS